MRSFFVLSSIATAIHANGLVKPSPATSDPTITPPPEVPFELLRKQNDNRFMGWVSYSGTWTTRECDVGGTLYQSGDYWRCCATTLASCNIPIGCISGSLIYSFTTGTQDIATYACTDVYEDAESFTFCNTGTLFENTQDSSPRTNVFCGVSPLNWSYYRVRPKETPSTTSDSSGATSEPSTTGTVDPQSSPSGEPTPQKREKSKSKAWIAGVVVGPIAGIAIIGLLAWIFLIKKKNRKTAATGAAATGPGAPSTAAPSYPGSPQQSYYQPMQQNNQAGFVPYGVGVQDHYANEGKHQSWVPQPPQSPLSHGSTSPQIPPSGPFGQPQQQWQPPAPSVSPQPQHATPTDYKQPHVGTTNFSSELQGSYPEGAPRSPQQQ